MNDSAPSSVTTDVPLSKPRFAWPMVPLALLLLLVVLPFGALVFVATTNSSDVWPHLLTYVLPRTVWQTLALLFLVALGTAVIGTGTAWLTTMCAFPGRRIFAWAMVLPLAVPTYIAAYTQVEFFEFSGPVQGFVRYLGDYASGRDYWFPDIRSIPGGALVFCSVLYPYVYLTSRLVFSMQGASALDASRSLGASPMRQFWQVGMPFARPALAAGVALALMETLNDIGAVETLGIKTLSYAIFETWLNRDSLAGASQLAILTLVLVAFLVWLERWARRKKSYSVSTRERPPALLQLSKPKQALCFLACTMPLGFGLGIPTYVLMVYALRRFEEFTDPALLGPTFNSLLMASLTAACATLIAYGVLQYARLSKREQLGTWGRIASLGYAVPGTVLAVGLLIPLAAFDNWFDGLLRHWFGISSGLLISGSLVMIVYACTLRFLAVAYGTLETGFARVSPTVDMAARALGRTAPQVAHQVHRPILMKALGVSFLLVFVDTIKELSATILLRPFNFETLATLVYNRASDAALEEASLAALIILFIGLIPIVFVTRFTQMK